ncbi:MAG: DUF1294 domain-containing protein [Candidatus Absconditabacterales bacterium]|nr:DUF1294 domain-containing protein [Candidatus Absconditabacterales bacterium]
MGVFLLLCCINILAVLTMGWDKWQARRAGLSTDPTHKPRRISERRLLLLSLCGGWLGIFLGITLFRHKTIKTSFLWRFYAIGCVWFGLIVWLMVAG